MWRREVSIFYTTASHTVSTCVCVCVWVCVCVPVLKEFHEHAFLLGIPGMTVVCFKKVRAVICFWFRSNSSCHIKYYLRWDFCSFSIISERGECVPWTLRSGRGVFYCGNKRAHVWHREKRAGEGGGKRITSRDRWCILADSRNPFHAQMKAVWEGECVRSLCVIGVAGQGLGLLAFPRWRSEGGNTS